MDLTDSLGALLNRQSREEPHLSRGLSSHGSCIAKQAFTRLFPDKLGDDDQGAMIRGKAFHTLMQGSLPSGTVIDGRWEIIGHEQYVFVVVDGEQRRSPIDTLVFDMKENRFEIWDWKNTRKDLKYVHELDRNYRYQANKYAAVFYTAYGAGTQPPLCRVIFANAANWAEFKEFSWVMDPNLAKESDQVIMEVHRAMKLLGKPGSVSPKTYREYFADGLEYWSATKKPYRLDCAYCKFTETCKQFAGIPERVNIKEDEIPSIKKEV